MRLDRLISILLILVEKKKVTGKELADYFEVSLRTIQRDINSLSTVGVPVYSDSGPNGGYRLLENYRLDKSFLKKDEASLLCNFIDSLYKTVPNESLKNIYHKFQVIKTQNQPVNNQHLQIQMNPWVEDEHLMTKLKAISKAIENNKRLMIEYLDLNNNKTSRVTEPYSLVVKESTWYLHAFCILRSSFRLFKLNRVVNYQILRDKFIRDEKYQPWEYSDLGIKTTRIILEFNSCVKGRLLDHFKQSEIKNTGDTILVEVNYPEDEWLYSLLLSFIPHVNVIEPTAVKDKLVKKLKEGLGRLCE